MPVIIKGADGEHRPFTLERLAAEVAPRAHTCFNRLDLPAIRSRGELKEMLELLLAADVGGFDMA